MNLSNRQMINSSLGNVHGMSRRSPAPSERKRDADRTREKILQAALEEFSEHGFSGARVSAIAQRAGVNQQLISYYFDGKAGLYQALNQAWREESAGLRPVNLPLAEVVTSFLATTPERRRRARILMWDALTGASSDDSAFFEGMASELKQRQDAGEIGKDFDPAALMLMLFSAVLAPTALPHVAQGMTGMDPESPEFLEHYQDQLRLLVARVLGD